MGHVQPRLIVGQKALFPQVLGKLSGFVFQVLHLGLHVAVRGGPDAQLFGCRVCLVPG